MDYSGQVGCESDGNSAIAFQKSCDRSWGTASWVPAMLCNAATFRFTVSHVLSPEMSVSSFFFTAWTRRAKLWNIKISDHLIIRTYQSVAKNRVWMGVVNLSEPVCLNRRLTCLFSMKLRRIWMCWDHHVIPLDYGWNDSKGISCIWFFNQCEPMCRN